jgi:hypothetical protein
MNEQSKEHRKEYNKQYYQKHKEILLPKIRERVRRWEIENKDKRNERDRKRRRMGPTPNIFASRRYRKKLREEALDVYGRKCSCCGESIEEFLTIDHVNGGGVRHRRELKTGGGRFELWLKKMGYPKEYRTLCWNCNWSAFIGNGICYHQRNLNGNRGCAR